MTGTISGIRLTESCKPGDNPPDGKHKFRIDIDSREYVTQDSLGNDRYLTGVGNLVIVDKVVQDAATEAPGVGLPSPAFGQKYLILTNVSSPNAGWATLPGSDGDIIYRNVDGTDWKTFLSPYEGLHVFDESVGELFKYSSSTWSPIKVDKLIDLLNGDTASFFSINRVDLSGGPISIVLPDATLYPGGTVKVKNISNSSNNLTTNTSSSQTIDGAASYADNTAYKYMEYISDGLNWMKAFN